MINTPIEPKIEPKIETPIVQEVPFSPEMDCGNIGGNRFNSNLWVDLELPCKGKNFEDYHGEFVSAKLQIPKVINYSPFYYLVKVRDVMTGDVIFESSYNSRIDTDGSSNFYSLSQDVFSIQKVCSLPATFKVSVYSNSEISPVKAPILKSVIFKYKGIEYSGEF